MTRLTYVLGFIGAMGITALLIGGNLIALPDDIIFKDGFENHPPVIVSTPKTSAGLNLPFSYDVDATDSDGDLLLYGLVVSPDGMVIDELTGEISWTPDELGIFPVEVLVSDGNRGRALQAWQIEVTEIVDSDKDGLSDDDEVVRGTDPNNPDSDNDGLKDGAEVYNHGTVPLHFDTDGDDFGDGSEILAGTNPLDPGDFPSGPADPEVAAPEQDRTVATTFSDSTRFLYTGDNPAQTGVTEGTIDPVRAAATRGRVLTRDGDPLAAATITVLDHPEFGQTLSRANGMFDLVVNGGGNLTINYSKSNFLSAQRRVDVPGQDWVWAEDVALIPLETIVTTVDLTQASEEFVVAQGSVINDSRGSRQSTLLFPQGTEAELVMPDGSTQAISTLSVRATEYSVGPNGQSAMPAELPLGIGYTYCVELSADEALSAGAKTVSFSQPVINYLENFLGFPAGGEIPVYFYDQEMGAWLPDQNGNNPYYEDLPRAVVIQILGVSEGLAELDANGNGYADNAGYLLENFGITDQERQRIASMYSVGRSLWRVPVRHFSTVDYNWPANYGSDLYPSTSGVKVEQTCGASCKSSAASVIDLQNQTLGESIGITGTPYSLNYKSDRTQGRVSFNTLDISLMGASCPATTCPTGIKLVVEVAGQSFNRSFPPDLNQRYAFTWNGKDAYGRTVIGRQPVAVKLGYEYPAQRCTKQGQCISDPTTPDILWNSWHGAIGSIDSRISGIGGWTVNVNHSYDPTSKLLNLGDGRTIRPEKLDPIIEPYAGNRIAGFSGDGGPATEAQLSFPWGIDTGPDGSLYIADYNNHRVRKVDPDGIITTVAGNGTQGFGGDGGPAVDAMLDTPTDIAVGADGTLYIVDQQNHRVRSVSPDGVISTFAGNGNETGPAEEHYSGYPATEGSVQAPTGIAIAPDQTVYVTDFRDYVWKIDTAGMKWRFAGNFSCIGFHDGRPALDVCLNRPGGISVSNIGEVFIADANWRRVRRIGLDGIITTVAGDGTSCLDYPECGDGGPAVAAQIGAGDVTTDQEGSVYVADSSNVKIRKVSTNGIISTIIGSGEYCPDLHLDPSCGDGGPASAAPTAVRHLALLPNGNFLISEASSNRIRLIRSPLPGFSATEIAIASPSGSELYVFDAAGRHLQTINTLTGTDIYTFSYESNGLLIGIEDADGNITTIERDPDGAPTAIVGPFGQRTDLTLDTNGYLATVSNPADETWQFGYMDDGLLTSAIDPNENPSAYTYDTEGRLILAEDAAGGSQALARVEFDDAYEVTRTTGMGRTTTYRTEQLPTGDRRYLNTGPDGLSVESLIGSDGSQIIALPDGTTVDLVEGPDPRFGMQSPYIETLTVTFPSGLEAAAEETQSAVVEVDPLSVVNLTTSHTFAGATTEDVYTASTRTLVSTSPEGRTATVITDEQARPLQSSVPGLHPMTVTYDVRGRLERVSVGTDVDVRATTFAYAEDGFLDSVTDPLERTVGMERDPVGRLVRSNLPGGLFVEFDYDDEGNLLSLTPPGRPPHSFAYDARGYLTTSTPPALAGTGPTGYSYDDDGYLTDINLPGDETVSFAYDSAGRPSSLTLAASGGPVALYGVEWNEAGLVDTITGPGPQNLMYTYDGALITGVQWSGTVAGNVTKTFDDALRLSGQQVNGGGSVTYSWDDDDLLITVGELAISRNPDNGLPISTSLGIVSDTLDYDGFGFVTHYRAHANETTLYEVDFERDEIGNVVRKVEAVSGETHTYDYAYDDLGQLTQVKLDDVVVEAYTYDDNGNRLSATVGGETLTATYDDQDRLLTHGAASFEYKPSGMVKRRTVSGNITDYTYDPLGNLLDVALPSGTAITYLLDGADRRVGRQINGAPAERFLYEGSQPVAQLDAAGDVVSRFVYAGGNVPTHLVRDGVAYRILTDQTNSVRLVVNTATGAIIQRMDYDAFGRVILDSNPDFQPFGFAGGLYDTETGLVHFGVRDYDPATGRWTAKDPIGFLGNDTNLYRYVFNNPINLIDPSGLNSVIKSIFGVASSVYKNLIDPIGAITRMIQNGLWGGLGRITGVDVSYYYQESVFDSSIPLSVKNSPEFGRARMICDRAWAVAMGVAGASAGIKAVIARIGGTLNAGKAATTGSYEAFGARGQALRKSYPGPKASSSPGGYEPKQEGGLYWIRSGKPGQVGALTRGGGRY